MRRTPDLPAVVRHGFRGVIAAAVTLVVVSGLFLGWVLLFLRLPSDAEYDAIAATGSVELVVALGATVIALRRRALLGVGVAEMTAALARAQTEVAARAQTAEHRAAQLRLILGLAREVSGSLNLRFVLDAVAKSVVEVGQFERVVIWLVDDEQARLTARFDTAGRAAVDRHATVDIGAGPIGRAAKFGQVAIGAVGDESASAYAIPMVVGARVIGVLDCRGSRIDSIGSDVAEALETLAVHAAAAIEAARLHGRTVELSLIDALTRLANRRRLDDDIEQETSRALRYGRPLSFVMVDLDHFKEVNDTFGHQRADAALQTVAQILTDGLRSSDSAYRYGGEELALLVRESTAEAAATLAERLRARIERHFAEGEMALTASFGVAQIPVHAGSARALLEAADRALYAAKRAGRNRVEIAACDPD